MQGAAPHANSPKGATPPNSHPGCQRAHHICMSG